MAQGVVNRDAQGDLGGEQGAEGGTDIVRSLVAPEQIGSQFLFQVQGAAVLGQETVGPAQGEGAAHAVEVVA